LNAEGAKVSQRAQKKIQKEYKIKYKKKFGVYECLFVIGRFVFKFLVFFSLLSSFALSAKPLRPLRSKNPRIPPSKVTQE
jgi:hypothetical protein